jgi:predicted transcriptional regulator
MQGLGPLEAAVMRYLWTVNGPRSVRDVQERLSSEREVAYTTVMTVMDNLHRKGFLARARAGRAYLYSAKQSREEYSATVLGDVLAEGGDRHDVLMHFLERLDGAEIEALRQVLRRPD